MQDKVLIIEDVAELSDLVAMYLSKEGIQVFQAESGEIALQRLLETIPDLVILDLNLPGMDGFEFLKIFRKDYAKPVMIVSARDGDEQVIQGLGLGADEFVSKPFSPKVLTARVKAILRRSKELSQNVESETSTGINFGPYVLESESFLLKKIQSDGTAERVQLSAKEFSVLDYLVKHAGVTLTPEVIYKEVWGDIFGDLTAVAVYIQRLRKKIEANPAKPVYLETVFGLGYRFNLK